MQFSHLHNHSQFSLLDGASNIGAMIKKAKEDNMPAVAITDHGNMFGVFQFVSQATKNGIKPIVGCEFYLVEDRHQQSFTKEKKDKRFHQLFLAKNATGYQNLVKLCSLGYIEGMYSKYPRIDKELVLKHSEGLIATTCCLGAKVPQMILKSGEEEAEKEFKWWLDLFGEDYYIEVQNHGIPEQQIVNETLLKFAQKYQVKVIASNDSHYLDQKDSNAHDILLCINTGEKQATPTYKDIEGDEDLRGKRFAFYNDQFYFKTTEEMSQLWSHIPQAIDNTNEIVGKVETLELKKDVMLPNFKIPREFASQDDYLEHLTWEGAKERYKEIDAVVEDRIKFEIHTIKTMGFAGYFLIVADFINAGKDLGVLVGPGRGSAAGSVVAYCLGITNIDPIKYNLLFERFLNPDRKSLPDIDTDFDDEGRQKVIDYVVDKYGKDQVAHIITYGTMAAKMSIKDVARVLDLPLSDSNELAKLVPDRPKITLKRIFSAPLSGEGSLVQKESLQADEIENVKKLRSIREEKSLKSKVLEEAIVLEGSVRGTGIHAAGVIIAPSDLKDILPVATNKDVNLLITQYDGGVIEDAGVIKMDFLGLKTLSILKEAVRLIEKNHQRKIDLDNIPLDDIKTYELYQKAETNGTFQFESVGMQKHLKNLKPDRFSDLIAMNALFRPGPMEYIPNYIARKHGKEPIIYDLPEMEEYLEDTYGITVYQEQVMLLSQKIGNFTKGDADVLRKAMGKKIREVIDKMKGKFIEGGKENGHPEDKLNKIWTDWEAFAQYAFNKSHSTCYAFVAYQTGYLKANFPNEYMAAVLSNSLGNIEKITFFMEECKRMSIPLLGPDVNESDKMFTVTENGIRFGMGAIKGVGDAAVISILDERNQNGPFVDIFDFVTRVNSRTVNKKNIESLALAGALDNLGEFNRAQYFHEDEDKTTFIEKLVRYGNKASESKQAYEMSLFGEEIMDNTLSTPSVPSIPEWNIIQKLKFEKEVVGVYISGHPLDEYRYEIKSFCNSNLKAIESRNGSIQKIAGIVSKTMIRTSANGNQFMIFSLEDFHDSYEFALFGKDFIEFERFIAQDRLIFVQGSMQPRFRNSTEMTFKIQSIQLLSELLEDNSNELKIMINAEKLSSDLVEKLNLAFGDGKGNKKLVVEVIDYEEKLRLDFLARNKQVNINRNLLKSLEKISDIEFILT